MTTAPPVEPVITREFVVDDEAWPSIAAQGRDPWVTATWTLLVDVEPGSNGDMHLTWRTLDTFGDTWRLEVFGDGLGFAVASGLIDLLRVHERADQRALREALVEAGWADITSRYR